MISFNIIIYCRNKVYSTNYFITNAQYFRCVYAYNIGEKYFCPLPPGLDKNRPRKIC